MKKPDKIVTIEMNLTKSKLDVKSDKFDVSTKDVFILIGMLERVKIQFANMIKPEE